MTAETGPLLHQMDLIRPSLAPNVKLIGELRDSGFASRQWLIQRGGRFIQVAELLYRVLEQCDGASTLEEIAVRVTEATQWIVTADHIRTIVETKLIPMELVGTIEEQALIHPRGDDRPRDLLMMAARKRVLGPNLIDPVSAVLQFLFTPAVLFPVLIATIVAHVWFYAAHAWAHGVVAVLFTPTLLLAVLAVFFVMSVFHEFGHAAALRYSGGQVRGIGVGFYLIYPAFYTDVTDSYRLGRWGRVRTDLGGLYFNLIFALVIAGIYALTRQEFLLAVILLIDIEIVQQLVPFMRFDGYWAFADLVGIPDPLSQIEPFLRSALSIPGAKLAGLKRWVEVSFGTYILLTVPVLTLLLVLLVRGLPLVVTDVVVALVRQLQFLWYAQAGGNGSEVALAVVQMALLALPVGGVVYILYSTGYRFLSALWRWAWGSAVRRLVAVALNAALIVLLAYFWLPQLGSDARTLAQARALLVAPSAKPIDGIHCNSMEQAVFHVHAHLNILDAGNLVRVPAGVGIKPAQGCLYWLHTHDASGVIHVEAPVKRSLTLGNFFDIWGKPLSPERVTNVRVHAGQSMRVYVNNRLYYGNPRAIPLRAHTNITIEIGPPFEPPQLFPFNEFGL